MDERFKDRATFLRGVLIATFELIFWGFLVGSVMAIMSKLITTTCCVL